MVVANCARSTSLAVNKAAVNVAMRSKDHANNLNLVPFYTVPGFPPGLNSQPCQTRHSRHLTAACHIDICPVTGAVDLTQIVVRDVTQHSLALILAKVAAISGQRNAFHCYAAGIFRIIRPTTFVLQHIVE